jgi:hypothetical protein
MAGLSLFALALLVLVACSTAMPRFPAKPPCAKFTTCAAAKYAYYMKDAYTSCHCNSWLTKAQAPMFDDKVQSCTEADNDGTDCMCCARICNFGFVHKCVRKM